MKDDDFVEKILRMIHGKMQSELVFDYKGCPTYEELKEIFLAYGILKFIGNADIVSLAHLVTSGTEYIPLLLFDSSDVDEKLLSEKIKVWRGYTDELISEVLEVRHY